jgi:hypothetical protein
MKNKWSHLPNAGHIDRVIASAKAHPEFWGAARVAARDAARVAAWDAVENAARNVVENAARNAAGNVVVYAAYDAIAALVAWDDCAQYLGMTSDQLKMWAILSEEPAAILLLPAVTAFEKINELELA